MLCGGVLVLALVVFPAVSEGDQSVGSDKPVLAKAMQAPSVESVSWATRIGTIVEEMQAGDRTAADADALYRELRDVLEKRRNQLREALGSAGSPSEPVDVVVEEPAEESTEPTKAKRLLVIKQLPAGRIVHSNAPASGSCAVRPAKSGSPR